MTKSRSPRLRSTPSRSSPTRTGRTTTAAMAPIASPTAQTRGSARAEKDTVIPSRPKAVISAMLAKEEWKRTISALYGARRSPTTMPAMKTARKPEPWSTVPSPKITPATSNVRIGWSAPVGRGTRRMRKASPRPPIRPTAAPMTISRTNSRSPAPTAPRPEGVAAPPGDPVTARSAAIAAMPTGSLAPDSPSRIVPDRPAISRRPRTEKTTAGSVGERATPRSRADSQSKPKSRWAAAATPRVVTSVPRTPSQMIAAPDRRNRRQPMCMPPSKSRTTSITVTTRWTVRTGTAATAGTTWASSAPPTRKSAGAGTRSRSLSRDAHTAASPARLTSRTRAA